MNNLDVTKIEDALTALINLVSIEEHAINSFHQTKDLKWLELNDIARKERTILLEEITKKENSQLWCINKHILTSIMANRELGNRYYSEGNHEKAKQFFESSGLWLGMFYVLNDINQEEVKK